MNELIIISHDSNTVTVLNECKAIIEEALAKGALIGVVREATDNEAAVQAQVAIKTVRKAIEGAYRARKDPLVQLSRKLDETYRALVLDLDKEDGRIGNLAGQFALAEKRRMAAEQIAQQKEIDRLEREKHEAIATTPDPVKQAQIIEDHSIRAAKELPMPSAPTRAAGQKVREEWVIEVVDKVQFARWILMSGRWECIDMEIRKTAVKELLEGGMKEIPGLKCAKEAKAGVTLPRAQKVIEV